MQFIELNGGKLFVISDTHFYHYNIIKYCNRPFATVEEMNEALINNWNATVGPNDWVIHCGDFMLGKKSNMKDIVSRLNGHKILLMGNHDHFSLEFALQCGFDLVMPEYMYAKLDGQPYMFSHHPIARSVMHDDVGYIFGHVHDNIADIEKYPNTACVCVERINYTPALLFEGLEKICIFPHDMSPKFQIAE